MLAAWVRNKRPPRSVARNVCDLRSRHAIAKQVCSGQVSSTRRQFVTSGSDALASVSVARNLRMNFLIFPKGFHGAIKKI